MRTASNCILQLALVLTALTLAACGGSSGGHADNEDPTTGNADNTSTNGPESPFADLSGDTLLPPKQPALKVSPLPGALKFQWDSYPSEVRVLLYHYDELTGQSTLIYQRSVDSEDGFSWPVSAHLLDWANTSFFIEVCDDTACTASSPTDIESLKSDVARSLQPDERSAFEFVGASLDMDSSGTVLIAGAPGSDSLRQRFSESPVARSGAMHSWLRIGSSWWYESRIEADVPVDGAQLGTEISVSNDGQTLVGSDALGRVTLFERLGEGWIDVGNIPQDGTPAEESITALVLAGDGNYLFKGACHTPGDIENFPESSVGNVYVYQRAGFQWDLLQMLEAPAVEDNEGFGQNIQASTDGSTVLISTSNRNSSETQILTDAIGTVEVYERNDGRLAHSATLDYQSAMAQINHVPRNNTVFGQAIALSDSGKLALVSLLHKTSNNHRGSTFTKPSAAIMVFRKSETGVWHFEQTIIPGGVHTSNTLLSIAIDSEASVIIAGLSEPSGIQNSVSTFERFSQDGDTNSAAQTWQRVSTLYAPDDKGYSFATTASVSGNGKVLAVSAPLADVGNDPEKKSAGLIYVYH